MNKVLLLFVLILSFAAFGQSAKERTQSFRAQIYHDYVRVTSPAKYNKSVSIILENNTLSDVIGRIITSNKKVISYVRIPAQKSKSIPIEISQDEKLFFESQSPPFQEVELIFSRDAYEIPPKR